MKPTIEDVILVERNVSRALAILNQRMTDLSISDGKEQIEQIEEDYRLMRDCVVCGMRDPQGRDVYDNLLRRTYRIYSTARLASIIRKRSTFSQCASVATEFVDNNDAIRRTLENYVQETAMATLLPESQQTEAVKKANAVHQRYMDSMFCSLVVADQWNKEKAEFFKTLILSPTIDHNDALVIVSAMTLALLTVFDVNKWLTLVCLYEMAAYEPLRQRALVGLSISLPDKEAVFFPEVGNAIARLVASDDARRELLELQMQVYYCSRTAADSEEIRRDIMPALIKNSNLKVTRNGIEEKVDDNDDILDPGVADRNTAQLESKMERVKDMQKSGSDIYFEGFSRMKRFPFFCQISNWFTPFNMEHPDVANAIGGNEALFLRGVLENGPFCDSDRYSFAFALASVVNKLPVSVKEMMAAGRGGLAMDDVDRSSSTYIRRMYLQDLYRFFMLYKGKKDFQNPLSFVLDSSAHRGGLFFANPVFESAFGAEIVELAQFFYRKRMYEMVVKLLRLHDVKYVSDNERLLLARTYMRLGQYNDAYNQYSSVSDAGNVQARKGIAGAMFMLRRYGEAAEAYGRLQETDRHNRLYIIYHSLSLINEGRTKEGLVDLFRLDYENSTDMNVKRAIAWGYLMDAKPREAESVYDKLICRDEVTSTDMLNCGYSKWVLCKNEEAVRLFRLYSAHGTQPIADNFAADSDVLAMYGILDYEQKIMLDIIGQDSHIACD